MNNLLSTPKEIGKQIIEYKNDEKIMKIEKKETNIPEIKKIQKRSNNELIRDIFEVKERKKPEINTNNSLITFKTKEVVAVNYQKLFEKEYMTEEDIGNMRKVIALLKETDDLTEENIEKLDNTIIYTKKARIINGIAFSREKFIPKVNFKSECDNNGIFLSNKKGIYKTIYNGNIEYYLTADQYRKQAKKQGKKAIKQEHIIKALEKLPTIYPKKGFTEAILGNILNLGKSGSIGQNEWFNKDKYSYLGLASPVNNIYTRTFTHNENEGKLEKFGNRENACPCLFIVE